MIDKNELLLELKHFLKILKKRTTPLRLGTIFFSSFGITIGLVILFTDYIALDLRILCSIGVVCVSLFCLLKMLVLIDEMEHYKISINDVYAKHKKNLKDELQYYGLQNKSIKQENENGNRSKREETSKRRTSKGN